MRRRVATSILCLTIIAAAVPARAQYAVRGASDRATGETYRVEIGGYLWNPTPDIAIASESLPGIIGDKIDFVEDLGLEKKRLKQLKIVLRPATKHKLRFEFTPIKYEQPNGSLRRSVVFNGLIYNVAAAGRHHARLEGVSLHVRVRHHLPRPRLLRDPARSEVHRRPRRADQHHQQRVRRGPGPDPRHRRHRPRLRRPQHLDHRRVQRLSPAGEHRRELPREVLRLRPVRHRQLQRQLRRPGRLPVLRRVLPRRRRRG